MWNVSLSENFVYVLNEYSQRLLVEAGYVLVSLCHCTTFVAAAS